MSQIIIVLGLFVLAAVRFKGVRGTGRCDDVLMAALCAGFGMGLNIDGLYLWLDPLLGGRNLVNLFCHLLVIGGLWFLRSAVLKAVSPKVGGTFTIRSVAPVVVTLALHAVFFTVSELPVTAASFNEMYGDQVTVALYTCSTMVYIAWVTSETGMACLRYVPKMTGAFRLGFQVLGTGCAAAMISALGQITFVLGKHIEALEPLAGVTGELYERFRFLSVLLIGIGLTIPPVAVRISRRRHAAWGKATNEKLILLRDKLYGVTGDRYSLPLHQVPAGQLTYRLLVEVRDTQLLAGDTSPLDADDLAFLDTVERRLNAVPAN